MSIESLKEKPILEVKCNWESNIEDKGIEDTILLVHDDKDNEETEKLNDLVNVKTTVSFKMPERHSDKPMVLFMIPPADNLFISSITLLCDSKAIEVFGDHRMYIETVYGSTVEETNDFFVYEYTIDLSKRINKDISLKFVKLARNNCLWIYGVLIKLKRIPQNSSSSTINYEHVQELLRNTNISEQASRAFSFLRDANSASRFSANGEGSSKSTDLQVQQMKQHIDYKFQILSDYLIMREKSLNDKLDRIIDMMKAKN